MGKKDDEYFHCPPTDLRGHRGQCQVQFAVSEEYNGGIVINDKWYKGYKVPPPILSPGFKLVGIGVGHQLNARPPYATQLLVRKG